MLHEPIDINSSEEQIAKCFTLLYKYLSEDRLKHVFMFSQEIFDYLCTCDEIEIFWYCECNTLSKDHFHYHILLAYTGIRKYSTWQRAMSRKFGQKLIPKKEKYTFHKKSEFRSVQCAEHLSQIIHYLSCNKGSTQIKYKICNGQHIHIPIITFEAHLKTENKKKRTCSAIKENIRNLLRSHNNIEFKEHEFTKTSYDIEYTCKCTEYARVKTCNSHKNHLEDVYDDTENEDKTEHKLTHNKNKKQQDTQQNNSISNGGFYTSLFTEKDYINISDNKPDERSIIKYQPLFEDERLVNGHSSSNCPGGN